MKTFTTPASTLRVSLEFPDSSAG